MSEGELAMSRLQKAPVIANPLIGAVGDVEGQFIGGSDGGTSVFGDRSLTVSIKSYAKDTLCLRFHTQHLASSDKPTHYDAQIEHAYHLYAPNALQMPDANEPSITAAKLTPVEFDARFQQNTYANQGDQVVEQHEYAVDEKFDVCFAHTSRVLEVAVELCARRLPLQERRVGLPVRVAVRRADRVALTGSLPRLLALVPCARARGRAEFAGSFTWPATDTLSAGVAVTTNPRRHAEIVAAEHRGVLNRPRDCYTLTPISRPRRVLLKIAVRISSLL